VNTDNDHIRAYSELSKVPYVIESDFRRVAILGSTKMLIIDEPETLDRLADELRTVFGSSLHITKSKPHYLEFLHPEATKGHALSYLAKHYRIPQEQTMAIGDSWNDHEMIQVAGLGVAMGNAVASLKQIADYITRSNNEEGVREVIEQFVLGSY
jgi:Cof subfamily protein (haloacid dehalogenase superfamily)